jgi:hypothetical protein
MFTGKKGRIAAILKKSGFEPSAEVLEHLAQWDALAIEGLLQTMPHAYMAVLMLNPWYKPQADSVNQLLAQRERYATALAKTKLALSATGFTYYEYPQDVTQGVASGELVAVPKPLASLDGIVVPKWLGSVISAMSMQLPEDCWMVTSGTRSLTEQALLQYLGYPAVSHGANNLRAEGLGGFNMAVANPFYKDVFLRQVNNKALHGSFATSKQPVTLANLRREGVIADGSTAATMVDAMFAVAAQYELEVVELTDMFSRKPNGSINIVNPVVQLRRLRA